MPHFEDDSVDESWATFSKSFGEYLLVTARAGNAGISGILSRLMAERRPSNSELRIRQLAAEESDTEPRGILEIFDGDDAADADAPLAREGDEDRQ